MRNALMAAQFAGTQKGLQRPSTPLSRGIRSRSEAAGTAESDHECARTESARMGGMPQTAAGKRARRRSSKVPARGQGAAGRAGARDGTASEMGPGGRPAWQRKADRYGGLPAQIHATRPPVGCRNDVISRTTSLSESMALAPTARNGPPLGFSPARRGDTMAMPDASRRLAAGQGAGNGVERGRACGWASATPRGRRDIERRDKEGRPSRDIREVPLRRRDPQLHTHVTVFNSVLTERGHIGGP